MKNNLDIDKIIQLRKFLRTTWQAYVSSMITLDNSMHNELKTNMGNMFVSKESLAFNFLTSTRAFIRIAEKISKHIQNYPLQEYSKNLNDEFPNHINARDIIEHFDEYIFGKGNLQKKNGLVLTGEPINVYLDDRSIVFIQVYNLNAIDISKMAYWIDGYIHYVEKKLHDLILPNTKWEGFNPQNF